MTRTSPFALSSTGAWMLLTVMLSNPPYVAAAPGFSNAGNVIGDDVLYSIGEEMPSLWAVPATCKALGLALAGTAT